MLKFNFKLKDSSEIVENNSLDKSSLNFSLKLKGLVYDKQFYSKVNFKIKYFENKNIISDLIIKNIDIDSKNSSSYSSEELISFGNIYTMSIFDDNSSSCDSYLEKKIYKIIKSFIKSIKVKVKNNIINKINFTIKNSKIKKLFIKGTIN